MKGFEPGKPKRPEDIPVFAYAQGAAVLEELAEQCRAAGFHSHAEKLMEVAALLGRERNLLLATPIKPGERG